jgi:hypothetical protein
MVQAKRKRSEIVEYFEGSLRKGDRVVHYIKRDGKFIKTYDVIVED